MIIGWKERLSDDLLSCPMGSYYLSQWISTEVCVD